MEDHDPRNIPKYLNFVFGATAGVGAMFCIQPAELVKIRMQVRPKGTEIGGMEMIRRIYKYEGWTGFYDGVTAAIFRQCTYTMSRLGAFATFYDMFIDKYGENPSLTAKVGMGCLAGAIAGVVGNPADLSMVRMAADGQLPKEQRRNYTNIFNALYRICVDEGVLKLWRGVEAQVARCVVVNGSTLAAYAHARELLIPYTGDTVKLHVYASLLAGVACTACSLPFDFVKARVQQSGSSKTFAGVVRDALVNEGPLAFYKGLIPMYITIGPQTILIFVFLERIKLMYRNYAYGPLKPGEYKYDPAYFKKPKKE